MYDTAVPTIATVVTGARALMANAREVAVEASKGTVSIKKKNLPTSGSKPNIRHGKHKYTHGIDISITSHLASYTCYKV